MNEPFPLDDLIADDLLLDRLAGRRTAGDEPVATLLCAVAAHADRPLTGRTRRRRTHGRRLVAALALLTVGASGAGVAAAVTLPDYLPGAAERARVEKIMEANAASNRPSALLSRLGLPAAAVAELGADRGLVLVLVRRADGQIVLVPTNAVAPGAVKAASGIAGPTAGGRRAGLTGTPQVPASDPGLNGNAYAFGRGKAHAPAAGRASVAGESGETGRRGPTEVSGPSGATDATAGQPRTDDDGDVASAATDSTAVTVSKGKAKVKATAVPRPTRPVPTPTATSTTSSTASVALVAPGSTSDSAPPPTSRRADRSTRGATPAPQGASRGSLRPTPSDTAPAHESRRPDASTQAKPANQAANQAKGPSAPAATSESSDPSTSTESKKPVTPAGPTTTSASSGTHEAHHTRPATDRSAGAAARPQSDSEADPVAPPAPPAATQDATEPE